MKTTLEPSSRNVADRAADAVPAQPRQARVLRFFTLTLFGAPTNFALYALLLHFTGMAAATATIIAALFVIVPKFLLSKYWVWKQPESNRVVREAIIYLSVTAGSLAVAILVALILEGRGAADSALVAANFASFALMWVVRFIILDRFAFASPGSAPITSG